MKIGQYLAKIWTRVQCATFFWDTVYIIDNTAKMAITNDIYRLVYIWSDTASFGLTGETAQVPNNMCMHTRMHAWTHTHTHTTVLRLYGFCPGQPRWAGTRRNIHPLTPIMVISHPLSASSIYHDPWHPACSIYMPDSLFPQSLSKVQNKQKRKHGQPTNGC